MQILYLTIFTVGFATVSAGLFFVSVQPPLMFLALLLAVSGAVMSARKFYSFFSQKPKASVKSETGEISGFKSAQEILGSWSGKYPNPEELIRLGYLIHLAKPSANLDSKLEFALSCFQEVFPAQTCIIYEFSQGNPNFVAGTIFESQTSIRKIKSADPLVEEVTEKLHNLIDFRKINKSKFFIDTIPLKRATDNSQLTIAPISFFGFLQGILAIIEPPSSLTNESKNTLLSVFTQNLAIMFQNHNLFVSTRQNLVTQAKSELCQQLISDSLPDSAPTLSGWEFAFFSRLSTDYSGDFYDFIDISDRKRFIIIGTTSGQGLNAALYFVRLRSIIRCLCDQPSSPAALLNSLSKILLVDSQQELFSTISVLEVKTGESEIKIAIAGHTLPMINRVRSGFAETASLAIGVPLGLFTQGNEPYTDQLIQLLPGDGVLLYTDGVIETTESNIERLTPEAMKIILENLPELSAKETSEALQAQLFHRSGSKIIPPVEDQTGIYLKLE
jgi:serine phosphatase RsbU (regulator of sigma subunit)